MIEPQQDNTTPPGFFVIIMKQFWVIWGLLLLVSPVMALEIVPTFVDGEGADEQWTEVRRAVVYQAIADWQAVIANDETIQVTFLLQHETTNSYFAMWYVAGEDTAGARGQDLRPWHPDLNQGVIINLSMPVWFDPTPETDDDLAKWDALTAIRHELGHMLGHRHGVYFEQYGTRNADDPWLALIVDNVFDPEGLAIPMANASHTTSGLMSPNINPRARHGVQTTAEMLYLAYGYERPIDPATIITRQSDRTVPPADAPRNLVGAKVPNTGLSILASDQVGIASPRRPHPIRWAVAGVVLMLTALGGIAYRKHCPFCNHRPDR